MKELWKRFIRFILGATGESIYPSDIPESLNPDRVCEVPFKVRTLVGVGRSTLGTANFMILGGGGSGSGNSGGSYDTCSGGGRCGSRSYPARPFMKPSLNRTVKRLK
jgi:hypothetical protein